ncbi:hypothetical protein [Mangrovicoccus sp. HB161399]|uniref:hypothetical protein n=1 Tax=Mangrovicoccus sp. HB161399 TaxID=2720392 RepID=UPI001553880B|nr:hypothetical protein [Mangrovicoccus sp. HB161399]
MTPAERRAELLETGRKNKLPIDALWVVETAVEALRAMGLAVEANCEGADVTIKTTIGGER